MTFTATIPGVNGNNVQIAINASDTNPVPVVVSGDLVTIYSSFNGTPLTLAQIAALFPSAETASGGQILCVASGTTSGNACTTAPTNLAGGTDGTRSGHPQLHGLFDHRRRFRLWCQQHRLPNQTYIDSITGFRVTIVNTEDHVAYGIPSIPAATSTHRVTPSASW